MRFIVVLSLLILVTTTSVGQQGHTYDPTIEKTITTIYKDLNAFKATTQDRQAVSEAGGAPTYGEILPKSVHQLIKYFKVSDQDIFYDLGSGNGKVPLQFYLTTPLKKSVGIELSKQRHQQALKAKKKASKKGLIDAKRSLRFIQADILKADFSDATLVYMCSTCYTQKMMDVLQSKMEKLKKGAKIATLKKFKKRKKLKLVTQLVLPMTWSKSSSVYIYEVA